MLKYDSIAELVEAAKKQKMKISEMVLADHAAAAEADPETLYARMERSFDVMCEAVESGSAKDQVSMSGLTGGEGYHMFDYAKRTGGGLSGSFMTGAMARALSVAGCNASMGRIVASPTAGSCGILPGCLVSLYKEGRAEKRDIVMSMFTSGAFGMVIAKNASIAGATGGCQAECGSASGMAAAALVELMGGSPYMCADALAIAIANQLGLACDPVAGLVEIPCIKRNVSGIMIAFSSADMVLAGIRAYIPADECISAMQSVGDMMNSALKETAGGGLAATPTGRKLKEKIFGTEK